MFNSRNIDNENPANAPKAMDWTSYHRVDEVIKQYLKIVCRQPNCPCTIRDVKL